MDILRAIQPYSFLLAILILAGVIISQTWAGRRTRWLGIAAALLIVGGWWFLRPGAGGSAGGDELTQALAAGRPVVVELYSDY